MCTRILYVVSTISCYPATIVPKVDKCKGIVIIFTVELKLSARSEVTIPSSTCFPDTYSKQVDVIWIIRGTVNLLLSLWTQSNVKLVEG